MAVSECVCVSVAVSESVCVSVAVNESVCEHKPLLDTYLYSLYNAVPNYYCHYLFIIIYKLIIIIIISWKAFIDKNLSESLCTNLTFHVLFTCKITTATG